MTEEPKVPETHITMKATVPKHLAPLLKGLLDYMTEENLIADHRITGRLYVCQLTSFDVDRANSRSFFGFAGNHASPRDAFRDTITMLAMGREATDIEVSRQLTLIQEQLGAPWADWGARLYERSCEMASELTVSRGIPPAWTLPNHLGLWYELATVHPALADLPPAP